MPSMAGRAKGFAFAGRSEERTSELQSHSEISYAVFCLKKKNKKTTQNPPLILNGGDVTVQWDLSAQNTGRVFFFFNDTATTETYTLSYTLSLHDALPI